MIRNLLQPADIKKKYTVVKAKYKERPNSRSPTVFREPAITIDRFAFRKQDDTKLAGVGSSESGLEVAKRPSTMKMVRKASAALDSGLANDRLNTSIDYQSMPDTTIVINNAAGSMAYDTPVKPQRMSHNNSGHGKMFLHLQEKQKNLEKNGSPKKLPAYVSICSLKKKKLKEVQLLKPLDTQYRKSSMDMSVIGTPKIDSEEKYYLKRNISNPLMNNTGYSFLSQGSPNMTNLRKSVSNTSFQPNGLAGIHRKSSAHRIKSRSFSSADLLRTTAILIEQ
jgi:hypothetical protein